MLARRVLRLARPVRYSHEGFQNKLLSEAAARSKQKPRVKSEAELYDPTTALVYADYLAEQDHPAESLFRWWADPERHAVGDRVGMRGMFVGPAAAPEPGDGIRWSIGHGRKVRQFPSHPLFVHVGFERGGKYGRVFAPVTPDEANSLADHIDRFYEGKHPIAGELREAAKRFSGRSRMSRVLRYARPKVPVEAMPDYLRFTRLGAVLREHAATGADDASHIAHAVLSTDDMTPLHALRDYMLENPEHPLAQRFNWEQLPEKVKLDQDLKQAIADHNKSLRLPGEGGIDRRLFSGHFRHGANSHPKVSDIVEQLHRDHPWITMNDLHHSAGRLMAHGNARFISTGREDGGESMHNDLARETTSKVAAGYPDNYARRGRPVRKAKADTRHVAHPLVAHFPIATFLKNLANDPKSSSTVRELAKTALTGGQEKDPSAVSMGLWMLHDALQEEPHDHGTSQHPGVGVFNLMSAADKVQLDQHTHRALTEAAEDTRRQQAGNPNYSQWGFSPEAHAVRAASAMTEPSGPDREAILARVRGRVAELSPGTPEKDVDESIRRHALRAQRVFMEQHDLPHAAMDRRALLPHGATAELEAMSDEGKTNDLAARYRRRQGLLRLRRDRARRYALQSGLAGFHEAMHSEPENHTHRQVYADWLEDQGHPTIAGMVRDDDDQREMVTPAVGPLAALRPGQFHAYADLHPGQFHAYAPGRPEESVRQTPIHMLQKSAADPDRMLWWSAFMKPGEHDRLQEEIARANAPDRYRRVRRYARDLSLRPLNAAVRTLGLGLASALHQAGADPAGRSHIAARLTAGPGPYVADGPRVNHLPLHPSLPVAQLAPADAPRHAAEQYGGLVDRLHQAGHLPGSWHRRLSKMAAALGEIPVGVPSISEGVTSPPVSRRPDPGREAKPFARRRYAAPRRDFLDALRRVRSTQTQALHKVATQVAARLGLHPTTTVPALHDGPGGSVSGIAQAVYGPAKPEAVHALASWIGLTGRLPGVSVFHVRPTGPDALWKFSATGSGHQLRDRLDRVGLTSRVLIPSKKGYDVLIPDQGRRQERAVRAFARQQGSPLEGSRGHLKTVGAADDADARAKFRTTIERGEWMSRRRYSAATHDLPAMLQAVSPAALRGDPNAEMTPRLVAADFMDDLGRTDEGAILRDASKHVAVHEGRVVPAKFTLRHIFPLQWDALYRAQVAHTMSPDRGLNPYHADPGRPAPAFIINAGLGWSAADGNIFRTPDGTDAVTVGSSTSGNSAVPMSSLPDFLADRYAAFLADRGVSKKSPLWRHVKRIRSAPVSEPVVDLPGGADTNEGTERATARSQHTIP